MGKLQGHNPLKQSHKDFILEIIEVKVVEKRKKTFSATLASIIFSTRSLNKVILGDSDIPNRIVPMNALHDIYRSFEKAKADGLFYYFLVKNCFFV